MKPTTRRLLSNLGQRLESPTTNLVAVAVLAGITPAIAHEFVGHGSVCLAVGGHPTVVSTSMFWCTTPEPVIAVGGPAMNLLLGLTCLILLRRARPANRDVRLYLALVTAFAWFWEGGYAVQAMLFRAGDLYDLFAATSRTARTCRECSHRYSRRGAISADCPPHENIHPGHCRHRTTRAPHIARGLDQRHGRRRHRRGTLAARPAELRQHRDVNRRRRPSPSARSAARGPIAVPLDTPPGRQHRTPCDEPHRLRRLHLHARPRPRLAVVRLGEPSKSTGRHVAQGSSPPVSQTFDSHDNSALNAEYRSRKGVRFS